MSDKMRAALFNMLGDISDLNVMDAFAGSGGLGFEALSRGANSVLALEIDKTAHHIISGNAKALGLAKQLKAVRVGIDSWSKNNPNELFDIILADPPYDDLQLNTLQRLTNHLKPASLFILSWPGHQKPPEFSGFKQMIERHYGDSQLVFYRN